MLRRLGQCSIAIAVLAAAAGVFGCGDSENPASPSPGASSGAGSGPGGGGNMPTGTGRLTVGITDSPFSDAKAVLVTFSEVSVHRSGAGWETVAFAGGAAARTCDLKKLQGPSDVLGVGTLPAGHYTQIRLHVRSAAIYFDNPSVSASPCAATITAPAGAMADVTVPSGEVKLNREFTLAAGGAKTMLLDFDGDRSIRQQGGGNAGGGGGGNGNGNGNGGGNGGGSTEPEAGRYSLQPVITIVSVQ